MSRAGPEERRQAAHADAVAEGRQYYLDPSSGLVVFTELHHRARGDCCGQACRHCPYDHVNVPGAPPVD